MSAAQQGKLPQPISTQPGAIDIGPIKLYGFPKGEKYDISLHSECNASSHRCAECGSEQLNQLPCRKFRWRLVLIPALLALLFIGALAMISCMGKYDLLGQSFGGILKRDSNDFVHRKRKHYLSCIHV